MIVVNDVYEYDIQHAGISMLYTYKCITKERYDYLRNLDKRKRVIQTGLLQKDNPEYNDIIKNGNKEYTQKFIKENNIRNDQVLEIANDAVWISGIIPKKVKFGDILFRKKEHFNLLYIYEKKNIRIYLNITNNYMRCRGAKLNEATKMYRLMIKIFKLYDNNSKDKLYEILHKTLNKLKEDPDYMGSELCKGLKNVTLTRSLIKDLIV